MSRPLRFVPPKTLVEITTRTLQGRLLSKPSQSWLTPLPCLERLSTGQQQAHYRRLLADIDEAAAATNKEQGRTPMDVQAILAQDPHHLPIAPDRSPAPPVHAHDAPND